jgi:hypothetical protein
MTELPEEEWHTLIMQVAWTDSGKLHLRHYYMGEQINHVFDIGPEKAKEISETVWIATK